MRINQLLLPFYGTDLNSTEKRAIELASDLERIITPRVLLYRKRRLEDEKIRKRIVSAATEALLGKEPRHEELAGPLAIVFKRFSIDSRDLCKHQETLAIVNRVVSSVLAR